MTLVNQEIIESIGEFRGLEVLSTGYVAFSISRRFTSKSSLPYLLAQDVQLHCKCDIGEFVCYQLVNYVIFYAH